MAKLTPPPTTTLLDSFGVLAGESANRSPENHAYVGLLVLLVVPGLLFTLYIGGVFAFSYSEGERAGVLQKFSRKGWVCKTYEGELAMSIVPG